MTGPLPPVAIVERLPSGRAWVVRAAQYISAKACDEAADAAEKRAKGATTTGGTR